VARRGGDIIYPMLFDKMEVSRCFAASAARSLSHGERVGVRGYGLSIGRNPSPGASRRPLPKGEVD